MVDTNSLQQGFSGASLMRGAFRVSRLRTLIYKDCPTTQPGINRG
jgi:hypothetical protein